MNHSEIRDVLIDKGVNPSKKLGQNFLTDANVARWIVDQLLPTTDDVVIEIGPGTGALTEHLVGRVKHVILVEFDARLAEYQSQKFKRPLQGNWDFQTSYCEPPEDNSEPFSQARAQHKHFR